MVTRGLGPMPVALVKGPASISRDLAAVGEATEVPRHSPGRGPPNWKSRVLRRQVLGERDEGGGGRGSGADEVTWGGDSARGPRGGGVCALHGVGATEHSRGGGERTCRARSGGPKVAVGRPRRFGLTGERPSQELSRRNHVRLPSFA